MVSIPSTGDRVSRWTPLTFTFAFVNFVLAQLLLVAGVSWAAAPGISGATLATIHLLTIGWIMLLMFGALFQFVPVITSQTLWRQFLSLTALLLIELGLAGMVSGFLLLGTSWARLLLGGGSAVIVGMLVGSVNVAIPLLRKRPWPLSARFIAAGLGLLLLTVLLGLSFALVFTIPAMVPALGPIVASGVEYHALAGIGGWFTLTAIGVSYELLPMFMLAPHDRGTLGKSVFWTAIVGFAVALGAGLIAPELSSPATAAIEALGRAAIAIAIALYLVDVVRMYRGRRRRLIELHNQAAIGAFVYLGAALVVAVASTLMGNPSRAVSTLLFLLIFGWLSGLGLSQLYKIVPFLAWLSRFGRRLGTGPVPRVQDLVNERAARYMFIAYFVAVGTAAAATFLDVPSVIRAAVAVMLGTTLLLGREYWRAWQGYYAQRSVPAPAPVPHFQKTKGAGHGTRATHA
jgi:hypothetical protein